MSELPKTEFTRHYADDITHNVPISLYGLEFKTGELAEEGRHVTIGFENPEGIERLMAHGVGGLAVGETVHFGKGRTDCSDWSDYNGIPTIRRLTRGQNQYKLEKLSCTDAQLSNSKAQRDISLSDEQITDFWTYNDSDVDDADPTLRGFSNRNDALGATLRQAGLQPVPSQDTGQGVFPLPSFFKAAIDKLREDGHSIAPIELTTSGQLSAAEFLGAFSRGVIPVSERFGWYDHDVFANHFLPHVVFQSDMGKILQLYARAAVEQTITVRPNNLYRPENTTAIQHAALKLDTATENLFSLIHHTFDNGSVEAALGKTRNPDFLHDTEVMVQELLDSDHRLTLSEHFDAIETKALTRTGAFSYPVLLSDMLNRARRRFASTPNQKKFL